MPKFFRKSMNISLISTFVLFCFSFSHNVLGQDDAYESALIAFGQKKVDEAHIHVKNALQRNPNYLPANILYAQILLEKGQPGLAQQTLEDAVQNGADVASVIEYLSIALVMQGKFEQVIELTEQRVVNKQLQDRLYALRAEAFYGLNDSGAAIELLNNMLDPSQPNQDIVLSLATIYLDENQLSTADEVLALLNNQVINNAKYWNVKARLLRAQGNYVEAVDVYQISLDSTPDDVSSLIGKANALLGLGQLQEAKLEIDKVLRIRPQDPFALYLKSVVYEGLNEFDASLEILDNISNQLSQLELNFKESRPELMLIDALSSYAQDNWQQARQKFEAYLKVESDDVNAVVMLAKTYINLDSTRTALKLLEKNESALRASPEYSLLFAGLYLQSDMVLRAENVVQAILKDNPSDLNAVVLLSEIYSRSGRVDGAISLLTKDEIPKTSRVLQSLAALHLKNGEVQQSYDYVLKMLEVEPNNVSFNLFYTELLLERNQLSEARDVVLKLQNIDPENTDVRFYSALIGYRLGDLERPREILQELVDEQGTTDKAALLLAELERQSDNPDSAVKLLEGLAKSGEFRKQALLQLAELYLAIDEPKQSLATSDALLRENTLDTQAMLVKIEALYILNQQMELQRYFNLLMGIWSDDPSRLIYLANIQSRMNQLESAEKSLERAIKVAPNDKRVILSYTKNQIAQSKLTKAKSLLAILDSPAQRLDEEFIVVSGDLQSRLGNYKTAYKYYNQALEINPSNIGVTYKLAGVSSRAGLSRQFIQLAKSLMEKNGQTGYLTEIVAEQLLDSEDYEESQFYYQLLLTKPLPAIKRAIALNNLAFIHMQLSQFDMAIELANQALEFRDDIPTFYDTLGWAHVQSGDYASGLRYLRQANVMATNSPDIEYHLAYTLLKLERVSEAKTILNRLVGLPTTIPQQSKAAELLNSL